MHNLIIGMTCSGKSTLAKQLVQTYNKKGINTIILDPLHYPDWHGTFQTASEIQFLEVIYNGQTRKCALFIDEAGESVGQHNKAMQTVATKSRHWGHIATFICQRYNQLSPNVKDQCEHLFCFRLSRKDTILIADEWARPELMEAVKLDKGTCLYCSRFSKDVKKLKVFS